MPNKKQEKGRLHQTSEVYKSSCVVDTTGLCGSIFASLRGPTCMADRWGQATARAWRNLCTTLGPWVTPAF
jgi:hypothetical protein